jgi:D-alanyl-D-alanine dipeptidase
MFVRFIAAFKQDGSPHRSGVFQASERLCEQAQLDREEEKRVEKIFEWFNQRLRIPASFRRLRGRQSHRPAVCWFKEDAAEHLAKMWELVAMLRRRGVFVQKLRTERVGYVVYEDAYQVTAIPFRDLKV